MEVSESLLPGTTAVDKIQPDRNAISINASDQKRGTKRSAEDDSYVDEEYEGNSQTPCDEDTSQPVGTVGEAAPMTKSQLKKLKRKKRWEDSKEDRRLKRRDKRHERQARKRVEREEEIAAAVAEGREPALNHDRRRNKPGRSTKVPVAIIIDCQFEKYMHEAELVSLSSQVTRCYSDNRGAHHPVHLYVSSYGGFLKERNETVLENQHLKWKGIRLCEDDFIEVANEAKDSMSGPGGGDVIDVLKPSSSDKPITLASPVPTSMKKARSAPTPEPEAENVDRSIVYLTADSPYTLDRLEPNTCYVVGGIIDKNREKGLCYRIAREKNVRTAKLPIGEYMVLQHRHILATNHVVEIMLNWLETGDWGTAFMKVIPTRKGGKLRADEDTLAESVEVVEGPASGEIEDNNRQADNLPFEAQNSTQDPKTVVEVEGDNAEEGLTKNALDETRWSAPPLELEMNEGGEASNNITVI